jgi:Tfp pilus assembly protein PilN
MSLPAEKPAAPRTGPPIAPRRAGSLNLAHRPFVNTRPVTRVSVLLWILGLLLLLGNVSLFWSYLSGSAEKRAELDRLKQDVQRQQQTVQQLEQRLASLNLEQQNRQVRYLNRKIAERTFSWSLLFDRVAEVLPDGVRLTRLAPRSLARKSPGRREDDLEPLDGRVQLAIHGLAKSDEELLTFVDRLFAHDSFDEPDLSRETRADVNDPLEFDVQVTYIPGGKSGQPVIEEAAPSPEIVEAPAAPPAAPAPSKTPDSGIDE